MLAPTKPPALEAPPRRRPPVRGVRGRRSGARRARRIALIAAVLLALPALVSYLNMLTQPSDSSLSIRTVEWMRDNGAHGLVNRVENMYYSLNAPATGGPALRALPKQQGVVAARTRARTRVEPPTTRRAFAR